MKSIESKLRFQGLLSEYQTYGDLCAPVKRSKMRGFCVNEKCKYPIREYRIKGIAGCVAIITDNKDIFYCESCGYAIFWSSSYKKVRNKNATCNQSSS